MTSEGRCPCGSGETYGSCCGRFHARFTAEGILAAPTPEALMRSRYSAFALAADGGLPVLEAEAYLSATWAPETRPSSVALEGTRWLRLDVESATGGPFDDAGTVTFTAHHRTAAGRHAQHETSRFVRRAGVWFYLDGEVTGQPG